MATSVKGYMLQGATRKTAEKENQKRVLKTKNGIKKDRKYKCKTLSSRDKPSNGKINKERNTVFIKSREKEKRKGQRKIISTINIYINENYKG